MGTRTIKCKVSSQDLRHGPAGTDELLIEGVPENAKVTFSRANPSGKGFGEPYALRIYTSGSNQLACILNVQEFWDSSLTVKKKVAVHQGRMSTRKASEADITTKDETATKFEFLEA